MPKLPIIKERSFVSKIGPKERRYTARVRVFSPESIEFSLGGDVSFLTPDASVALQALLREVNAELGLTVPDPGDAAGEGPAEEAPPKGDPKLDDGDDSPDDAADTSQDGKPKKKGKRGK